jgi:hypothetical protein
MTVKSWALEAALKGIEAEAMERAVRRTQSREPTMFGLRADQVAGLIRFFVKHTGKGPETYSGNAIEEMELKA